MQKTLAVPSMLKADCPHSGNEGVPMATAPTVHKPQTTSHDKPDELRAPDKTRVEVVRLEGFTIGRLHLPTGLAVVTMRQARGQNRQLSGHARRLRRVGPHRREK
jgi:hypothetical protein